MKPNQASSGDPKAGRPRLFVRSCHAALPLVVAALAAHGAVIMTERLDTAPLLSALTAALVYVSVSSGYGLRIRSEPSQRHEPMLVDLAAAGLTFAGVFGGVWIIGLFAGTAAEFYCTPLVPWRIEIAIFGSWAIGVLTAMAEFRGHGRAAYSLTIIGLAWIAPFYGFFSAPILLAMGLNTLCPDRTIVAIFLAAAGMLAGARIAPMVAVWLVKRP